MRTLALAAVIAPFIFPAHAQPGPDPSAPIAALNQALATAQKTGTAPFPKRYEALAPAIDRAFDLPRILQTIVGLRWSAIPEAQKTSLLATFRAYTISNYAANFAADSGDTIRTLPETRTIGADKVVETQIVPKTGDSFRIDYVMRAAGGTWRAIDVLQEGTISQVAVQRHDFRGLLDSGADKLVAGLQAKVDTLSGHSINPGQPGPP